MSSERPTTAPADAIKTQREATDPTANAWVSANAGSGKTFILTRRVIRLLLSGAAPESILCLTYTKAAAAEMRHRVSQILGQWTLLDEHKLARELADMTGTAPDATTLNRARQLFALALETPGGLKINTIHAFCEAVLQRFPLEAGVPINFAVIEEADRSQMILDAREAVLAEGLKAKDARGEAARLLFSRLSDHQIEKAVEGALGLGRKLETILADPAQAKANLNAWLGLKPGATAQDVLDEMVAGMIVAPTDWPDVLAITPPEAGKSRFEEKLAALDPANVDPMQLVDTYLTADRNVPKAFPKKAFEKANPVLAANLLAEAERLYALLDLYRAHEIAAQSGALVDIVAAIVARYEEKKRARSWLDFDDLVVRTAALFANGEYGAWVRYKLDAGIDHILVDESQDTNPEQWQVIKALAGDFFAGEGTGRPKTLFAVGDPKQSIYSFQGAEPSLFLDMGRETGLQARQAGLEWRDRTLRTSFRTLTPILDGVDLVAARPEVAKGLFAPEDGIKHESARDHKGGAITLWAPVPPPEIEQDNGDWPLVPQEDLASAPRQLARKIAKTIKHWVETGAPLGPRGRAIVPEDVLVLVQRRSPVFHEIVRALKEARIESPGADRLPVSAHIAVDDLLGLADVLLNPGDDLTLAAILRSPIFALSEDALYAIAQPRGSVTLWQALRTSEMDIAKAAFEQLFALRQRLDLDRPYEFFAHVLYAQEGLKRFHERLGAEVDEVIGEFLDLALEHEQSDQPSLTGFIAAMRKSDIVIKRDLVGKSAGARVMTVHGAKGLEAPIVILADACAKPPAVKASVFAGPTEKPFLLYRPSTKSDSVKSATLVDALRQKQDAEYWRNLYVAMTRAEDGLIVAGCLARPQKDKTIDELVEGSWYGAIRAALAHDAETMRDDVLEDDVMRFPRVVPPPAEIVGDGGAVRRAQTPFTLPKFVPSKPLEIVSPSTVEDGASTDTVLGPDVERLLDAGTARDKGIALHALLQHLMRVPEALRRQVALVAAETLLPEMPALARSVAAEALEILADPALSHLFGANGRSEVSFALAARRNDKPVRLAGRMDRLVFENGRVTIVDFKSDALAPETQDGVPEAYWVQLGLYAKITARLFPQLPIDTAILWTSTRHLMVLDADRLAAASAAFTLG